MIVPGDLGVAKMSQKFARNFCPINNDIVFIVISAHF